MATNSPSPLSGPEALLAARLLYQYAQTSLAEMNEDVGDALVLVARLLGVDSTEVQDILLGGTLRKKPVGDAGEPQ